ncbi:hypothetical protein PG996_012772 [Apiospora saccharicola]|uniref:PARP catalytic domain-containing protein n=1 Tax=Apiospora saccharicola TaxID=335842 RepID=A0ABR1U3J6_9PEZI
MVSTHLFSEDDLIELSFLRDLEADQLIAEGLLGDHLKLSSPLDEELAFAYDELTLHVLAGPHYPAVAATWSVEGRHTFSRTAIIDLRARLGQIVEEATHTNNMDKWLERESGASSGIYEPTMVVLLLVKETVTHTIAFRQKVEERNPNQYRTKPELKQVANITQIHSAGIERDTAFELLGKTPGEIIRKIPPEFRVLHVKEVLRQDLLQSFQGYQKRLHHQLSGRPKSYLRRYVPHQVARNNRVEDMVEHIVKPYLTWHGTQRQFVPSIVRNGFLKPGTFNPATKSQLDVRCGSTYGRGIYSSPDPAFSLSYTNWMCEATPPGQYFGLKLIVCATLMGRTSSVFREQKRFKETQTHSEDVDSYVANRELEYIVFSPAQIVPVYVVHLDWGERNAAHFAGLPTDPSQWIKVPKQNKTHKRLLQEEQKDICPADKQRAKQAIMARASKWFPYGYGPATNGKFVVEEVGEVDDDEEDYGDYQALRGEDLDRVQRTNKNCWSWAKAAEEKEAEEKAEFEEMCRRQQGKGGDEYWQERRGKASESQLDPVVLGHDSSDDEDYGDSDDDEDGGFGLERLRI